MFNNRDKTVGQSLEDVMASADERADLVMKDFEAVFNIDESHPSYVDVHTILFAEGVLHKLISKINSHYGASELHKYFVASKRLLNLASRLAGRPAGMTDDDYFEELIRTGRRKYSQLGKYSQEYAMARKLEKTTDKIVATLQRIDNKLQQEGEE